MPPDAPDRTLAEYWIARIDAARAHDPGAESFRFPLAASGRALSLMETDGFVKVIADAQTPCSICGMALVPARELGYVDADQDVLPDQFDSQGCFQGGEHACVERHPAAHGDLGRHLDAFGQGGGPFGHGLVHGPYDVGHLFPGIDEGDDFGFGEYHTLAAQLACCGCLAVQMRQVFQPHIQCLHHAREP